MVFSTLRQCRSWWRRLTFRRLISSGTSPRLAPVRLLVALCTDERPSPINSPWRLRLPSFRSSFLIYGMAPARYLQLSTASLQLPAHTFSTVRNLCPNPVADPATPRLRLPTSKQPRPDSTSARFHRPVLDRFLAVVQALRTPCGLEQMANC